MFFLVFFFSFCVCVSNYFSSLYSPYQRHGEVRIKCIHRQRRVFAGNEHVVFVVTLANSIPIEFGVCFFSIVGKQIVFSVEFRNEHER